MFKKVSRKAFLSRYPDFATANHRTGQYHFPDTVGNYVLAVNHRAVRSLCKNLSYGLSNLNKLLGYDSLSFLGDTATTWLYRHHNHPPVKRALAYLAGNNISKSFNGAINVDNSNLPEFCTHLFWLIRCNGILITPHFSDPGFNIIGSICQYGNIHISTLNDSTDLRLKTVLSDAGFYLFEDNHCGGGRIAGSTTA